MTTVSWNNLEHAILNNCQDPDCEIHQPEAIEEEPERQTAKAWFLAGALAFQLIYETEGDLDVALDVLKARYLLRL